jgi:CO/xanthine dehydrogenase FAD-binding subunit
MNAAQNGIDPTGDIHSTADYKRHLAYVLSKRAIRQAVARAREAREL